MIFKRDSKEKSGVGLDGSKPGASPSDAETGDQIDPPRVRSKARPADWPPVNTEIVIVLPKDGGIFKTTVSEHDKLNGHIVLAPSSAAADLDASSGNHAMATWTSQAGLHELRAEILAPGEPNSPIKVEPTSPVVVHERRRFPRVRRPGGIKLETGSHSLSATMLDLSEGGARCVVDTSSMLSADMLQTTLNLDDQAVKIKGWVAWKKLHGQHTEIGVSFAGVSTRDAELIRRYVISLQRRNKD